MSSVKIKSITIKNDKVFLNSSFNPSLTDVYHNEGEDGLNRELIKMFWEYAQPSGNHESILPFLYLIRNKSEELEQIHLDTINFLNKEYIFNPKNYIQISNKAFKEMYTKMAKLIPSISNYKFIN